MVTDRPIPPNLIGDSNISLNNSASLAEGSMPCCNLTSPLLNNFNKYQGIAPASSNTPIYDSAQPSCSKNSFIGPEQFRSPLKAGLRSNKRKPRKLPSSGQTSI